MTPETTMRYGRYEILEELGRGAMGVVYLARDPVIGRLLALKTLRLLDMGDAEETAQFRRRFIREAQSAGILSHPNIVTIHDVVDEGEGGPTFIAMEYVRGTDLKSVIRREPRLELDFITDIIRQVAAGLDYAHAKGVVHRDVKPANVLLTEDQRVKITDFGIARLDASSLTLDHELLGTPNYMAPEQILGHETDHRLDVFALGVLIYELLTGSKPFKGDNLTAVTHRIVYEDHTPVQEHASHLPAEVEPVIAKALAKAPGDRYESCGELAAELSRCLECYDESASDLTQRLTLAPPPPPVPEGGLDAPGPPPAGRSARSARPARPWHRWADWWARPEVLRGFAIAGVAAVLTLFVGIVLLHQVQGPPAEALVSGDDEIRRQYLNLVRDGRRLLDAGDPSGALLLFGQAERLAPYRDEAGRLRSRAQAQVDNFDARERQVAEHLAAARKELSDRRYPRALAAVDQALAIDPENPVAASLRNTVAVLVEDEASGLRAARKAPPDAVPTPGAPPATRRAGGAAAPSGNTPPQAGRLALTAVFVSYFRAEPIGTLTVLLNGQTLAQQEFRFLDSKGFLGLEKEAYDGRLTFDPVVVESGEATFHIYVTPKGEQARSETFTFELKPGQPRRLAILWSKDGELTARLE